MASRFSSRAPTAALTLANLNHLDACCSAFFGDAPARMAACFPFWGCGPSRTGHRHFYRYRYLTAFFSGVRPFFFRAGVFLDTVEDWRHGVFAVELLGRDRLAESTQEVQLPRIRAGVPLQRARLSPGIHHPHEPQRVVVRHPRRWSRRRKTPSSRCLGRRSA